MFTAEVHVVTQISDPKGQNHSWFNFIVFCEKLIGFIAVRLSQYEDEVQITLFICVSLMTMQSWFILSGAN